MRVLKVKKKKRGKDDNPHFCFLYKAYYQALIYHDISVPLHLCRVLPWFSRALSPAFFAVLIVLACCENLRRQVPANYILLGLFVSEASPWPLALAMHRDPVLLPSLVLWTVSPRPRAEHRPGLLRAGSVPAAAELAPGIVPTPPRNPGHSPTPATPGCISAKVNPTSLDPCQAPRTHLAMESGFHL